MPLKLTFQWAYFIKHRLYYKIWYIFPHLFSFVSSFRIFKHLYTSPSLKFNDSTKKIQFAKRPPRKQRRECEHWHFPLWKLYINITPPRRRLIHTHTHTSERIRITSPIAKSYTHKRTNIQRTVIALTIRNIRPSKWPNLLSRLRR